jgi:hypothetical protein
MPEQKRVDQNDYINTLVQAVREYLENKSSLTVGEKDLAKISGNGIIN